LSYGDKSPVDQLLKRVRSATPLTHLCTADQPVRPALAATLLPLADPRARRPTPSWGRPCSES